MKVAEIYESIDGEGRHAGKLSTFLRLAGCNLSCPWCDTKEWQDGSKGASMTSDDVLERIYRLGTRHLTITGGEPLLQEDVFELVRQVVSQNISVCIETNGSVFIGPLLKFSGASISVDYKCPSSGYSSAMIAQNFPILREIDLVKFVAADINDLKFALKVLGDVPVHTPVYVSPVYGWRCGDVLKDWLKAAWNTLPHHDIRIQTQLHKVLWRPEQKGV